MVRARCAICKLRKGCKFRQPGTWVVQCEVFEEDPRAVSLDSPAGAEPRSARQPTLDRSYRGNE